MALIISIITLIAVFLSILFFPEIKIGKVKLGSYWVISLIGAILVLIVKWDFKTLIEGLTADSSVNPLKILILFFSMTLLSVFLDEMGFFEHLASMALKRANSSQTRLFFAIYAVVSLLTVFTSNDIVILTFTPFICFFCKRASINPLPYLIGEFVAANTWSMLLIIGNPTNVYLAESFNISFIEYFKVMALPTVVGGLVSLLVVYLLFRKSLKKEMKIEAFIIPVKNKSLVISGIIHLGLCTMLLVVSSYIGIEMWLLSLFFAVSLILFTICYLLVHKTGLKTVLKTLKRLPFELIPFLLSMFTLVLFLGEETTVKIADLIPFFLSLPFLHSLSFCLLSSLCASEIFYSFMIRLLRNRLPVS